MFEILTKMVSIQKMFFSLAKLECKCLNFVLAPLKWFCVLPPLKCTKNAVLFSWRFLQKCKAIGFPNSQNFDQNCFHPKNVFFSRLVRI